MRDEERGEEPQQHSIGRSVLLPMVLSMALLGVAATSRSSYDSTDLLELSAATAPKAVKLIRLSRLLVEFGRVVLVFMFIGASGSLGVSGFTGIAQYFKYPAPSFMGLMAFLFCSLGSIGVIAGPLMGCAMTSIIGAKLLIIFLIIATYSGHYKPLAPLPPGMEKMGHWYAMWKNIAIIGALLMIIGYDMRILSTEVPEILEMMHLSKMGWLRYARIVIEGGKVVLMSVFFVAAMNGVSGYTGIATFFGFPCPSFMAVMAMLFLLVGSVSIIAGPLVQCPVTSIAGSVLLIVFMLPATYAGHYKPMRTSEGMEATKQQQQLMKNVSIIGALIVIIGYETQATVPMI